MQLGSLARLRRSFLPTRPGFRLFSTGGHRQFISVADLTGLPLPNHMAFPKDIDADLTYNESLAYLMHTADYTGQSSKYKYQYPESCSERMRQLLARVGNPHEKLNFVHITGTKGKGSTSAYTDALLRARGYKTGLYTSPHLHTFRERIRVNGEIVKCEQMASLTKDLRKYFDEFPKLTVFEKITALALTHYANEGVEWAVLEVGMGGRLDSTNVVLPKVCGITRISLDHVNVLGNTIGAIAYEKAGIIKQNVPVFVAEQDQEAMEVLEDVATKQSAPLHVVTEAEIDASQVLGGCNILKGRHQRGNAELALQMINNLCERSLVNKVDDRATVAAMSNVYWPGRFEVLPQSGPIDGQPGYERTMVVDCAHNTDSSQRLIETIQETFPDAPVTFLFGANSDKQVLPMASKFLKFSPRMVTVQSRHPKALQAEELFTSLKGDEDLASLNADLHVGSSLVEALRIAHDITPQNGIVVATGSVFVVPEIREIWARSYSEAFAPSDWVHEAALEPSYNMKGPERKET